MKNSILFFLILSVTFSFSQIKIDTTQVEFVRHKWRINKYTKDTLLSSTLTKYKSGFYYEDFTPATDSSKYGRFLIYKTKKDNLLLNPRIMDKGYVTAMDHVLITNYYDSYGNCDSIIALYDKPKSKKRVYSFKKKYKRKGKLEFIEDEKGINFYKYNIFGRLKRIEHFRNDTILYRIRTYKKNRLISEIFPTREKYSKKYTYTYDKIGRIIKRYLDDYNFYRYEYNEFGISKEERIYKKQNIVIEHTLFTYDENGLLKAEKKYDTRNGKLMREFFYIYE